MVNRGIDQESLAFGCLLGCLATGVPEETKAYGLCAENQAAEADHQDDPQRQWHFGNGGASI